MVDNSLLPSCSCVPQGIREAPTKAIMNELARESGDAPDAAYGEHADSLAPVTRM
jgi:hypothetical protein